MATVTPLGGPKRRDCYSELRDAVAADLTCSTEATRAKVIAARLAYLEEQRRSGDWIDFQVRVSDRMRLLTAPPVEAVEVKRRGVAGVGFDCGRGLRGHVLGAVMGPFEARDWVELIVSQQGLTKGFTGEVQGCVKRHSPAGPFWVYVVSFPGFGPFEIPEKDLVPWVDPESVTAADEVPKPTIHTPPPCSFCGEPNACAVHVSGLRCQAEPWPYCARVGCCESIDLHVSRLENGLVDCPETRAATRAWYLAKVEREKKEAREARLARMVP